MHIALSCVSTAFCLFTESIQTYNSTGSGCLQRRLDYLCFINKARKCKVQSTESQLCITPGAVSFLVSFCPVIFVYFLIFTIAPLSSGPCVPHYPCSLPKLRETLQANHVAIDFCPLCSPSDFAPCALSPTGFRTWLSRPRCWQEKQHRAAF